MAAADHPGARTGDSEEEEMIDYLERDQLVSDRSRPLPRAALSRPASVALWSLRGFVLILSAMVIYTFCSQLGG